MYDYSDFQVTPTEELLQRVSDLADKQIAAAKKVEELSLQLEVAQQELQRLSSQDIPQLLEEFPQTRFELPDCRVVEIKETMRTSISKANEEVAFEYIVGHGAAHIIKRKMTMMFSGKDWKLMQKLERDLKARKHKLNYKVERSVHHMSLAAFVREQLAAGEDVPKMEFNLFQQKETIIS